MKNKCLTPILALLFMLGCLSGCKIPVYDIRQAHTNLPASYPGSGDSSDRSLITWRDFFADPDLKSLIDTALQNNQELNILLREIAISRNEIRERKGEYLPFVGLSAGHGYERSGQYTFNGLSEEDVKARGEELPRFIGEQAVMANFSWEIDVWRKLRNAKASAVKRFLAAVEGRNFAITHLVTEISIAYYELQILDQQLAIIDQNIDLQQNALDMITVQKQAARANQLAVNRFEAQLLNTQNLRFELLQQITETENKINFFLGRFPQPIKRGHIGNGWLLPDFTEGIPANLLANRADIRQAEQQLEAAKLDVQIARADFYPNFSLRAGLGFQSFNPAYLINPKSIAFNVLGDAVAPLINRNAIKARYASANEKQLQAIYTYEQTILNAYVEVMNQMAGMQNYSQSFETKQKQVDMLTRSINISDDLFKTARADYTEVLFTQREALDAKMELMEIKMKQISAQINLYRALGGGWR